MRLFRFFICAQLLYIPFNSYSLPIGFDQNQQEAKYQQKKSEYFHIYHDSRVPNESAFVHSSLTSARPIIEKWFNKKRSTPLPVITSAISTNASFANFVTDVLEIQTKGQGYRDLYWHEYTHENMYRHLQNWLGPAGTTIHLATLPQWFIEGLAETISVSAGSDFIYSIERLQALTGKWPSYDRLHHLYGSSEFSERGYAIAGAFVSWILSKYGADKIHTVLDDFYKYSMPWYWPWAAVPFNNFLPLDKALQNFTGLTGPQLYEQYKAEAEQFHKKNKLSNFITEDTIQGKSKGELYKSTYLHSDGNDLYLFYKNAEDRVQRSKILHDTKTNKLWDEYTRIQLPEQYDSFNYAETKTADYFITGSTDLTTGIVTSNITKRDKDNKENVIYRSKGSIVYFTTKNDHLFWLEEIFETTRLCFLKIGSKSVQCQIKKNIPESLSVLGDRNTVNSDNMLETDEIWLKNTIQSVNQDKYEILVWNLKKNKISRYDFPYGKPLSVGFTKNKNWVLAANSYSRGFYSVSQDLKCMEYASTNDFPRQIRGNNKGQLFIDFYVLRSNVVKLITENQLKTEKCPQPSHHRSPLLYALNQNSIPSLQNAIEASSPWSSQGTLTYEIKDEANIVTASNENTAQKNNQIESESYSWSSRPIFLFPYIGADDPISTQFGFISIPIMDFLQNETLRASFLYGTESHFPNTELSLVSTRYWPTLEVAAYRQQKWNGSFFATDGNRYTSYYDEKGVRVNSRFPFHFYRTNLTLDLGGRFSHLKPYLGPFKVREGRLNEPNGGLTLFRKFENSSITTSIVGKFTSEEFNESFDYNQLGFFSTYTYNLSFLNSRFSTGIDTSRTRGKKMLLLKEVYTPLKTFIPGSGGGLNQNSFLLAGPGSMFSTMYGTNQGRAKVNWTLPLKRDIDKLIGIVYVDRLDFSTFYNYGGAWYGEYHQAKNLVSAHGYNLDLQFKIQSLNFNAGMGVGQVVKRDFEVYASFGFDAIF